MTDKQEWVLIDTMETKERGAPAYLWKQTGIGPAYTENLFHAQKFESASEAMQHPAYAHPMCSFVPDQVQP